MSEIIKKLEYVSEITKDEVRQFTCYDEYKEKIDAFTGHDNLNFPFVKAEISEFVIRLTLPDQSYMFLPIYATDEQGFRYDDFKGYSTIHRPLTERESVERAKEEERRERERRQREEWEMEQRAKNASQLEKAKLLVKKKADRQKAHEDVEQ